MRLPLKRLSVLSHDASSITIHKTTTATRHPAMIGAIMFSFSFDEIFGAFTIDLFISEMVRVTKPTNKKKW